MCVCVCVREWCMYIFVCILFSSVIIYRPKAHVKQLIFFFFCICISVCICLSVCAFFCGFLCVVFLCVFF